MVSANKLIYDFVRKINSVNSSRVNDFRIVDIVAFINEAYEVWYENKVAAAETNSKVRNDLRVFEIKGKELECIEVDCNICKIEYPPDLYSVLNREVLSCNTECCGDIEKRIPVSIVQSDDLPLARRNPYTKSDFKWERVIGDEAGKGMYLYHDGSMSIKKVLIDYFKKLSYIQAPELVECKENAYRDYDDELITKNVDLEIDTYGARQITDIAVLNASDAISDTTKYQVKLKSILQLDTLYR